jgi:hypothetical protein
VPLGANSSSIGDRGSQEEPLRRRVSGLPGA